MTQVPLPAPVLQLLANSVFQVSSPAPAHQFLANSVPKVLTPAKSKHRVKCLLGNPTLTNIPAWWQFHKMYHLTLQRSLACTNVWPQSLRCLTFLSPLLSLTTMSLVPLVGTQSTIGTVSWRGYSKCHCQNVTALWSENNMVTLFPLLWQVLSSDQTTGVMNGVTSTLVGWSIGARNTLTMKNCMILEFNPMDPWMACVRDAVTRPA